MSPDEIEKIRIALAAEGYADKRENFSDKSIIEGTVKRFLSMFHFATMRDNLDCYVYDSSTGVYGLQQYFIEEMCQATLKVNAVSKIVNDIVKRIKFSTLRRREELDSNPSVLNVRNGLLDLNSMTLKPHTPDYLSTIQLPVTYDPSVKCEAINSFLDASLDQANKMRIIKMLGDILVPDYRYQCFYMLIGSGSNGKGTIGRLIKKFVGLDNLSAVRLQSLTNDRFSRAYLFGKMVNFAGDISAGEIKDWAILRSLTGGDVITAEFKGTAHFNFENRAKLIFAFNKPPELDNEYSTMRRLVLVVFERKFEGEDKDDQLDAKLQTDKELSGLLNLAIEGMERLKMDGGFSNENWRDTQAEYMANQDHVFKFVKDRLIVGPQYRILKADLRKIYVQYCEMMHHEPLADNMLGSKLVDAGIESVKVRIEGEPVYFYKGAADAEGQRAIG